MKKKFLTSPDRVELHVPSLIPWNIMESDNISREMVDRYLIHSLIADSTYEETLEHGIRGSMFLSTMKYSSDTEKITAKTLRVYKSCISLFIEGRSNELGSLFILRFWLDPTHDFIPVSHIRISTHSEIYSASNAYGVDSLSQPVLKDERLIERLDYDTS